MMMMMNKNMMQLRPYMTHKPLNIYYLDLYREGLPPLNWRPSKVVRFGKVPNKLSRNRYQVKTLLVHRVVSDRPWVLPW